VFDTIVVGAGVIGTLTAQLLSQQGQSVCLIEKGNVGSESSWAGGGILSPLYPWRYSKSVNDLAAWSQQHYPKFLSSLTNDTGIDSQHLYSGLLILNINQQKSKIEAWLKTQTYDAEFVTAKESLTLEPLLRNRQLTAESLWLPQIGQVRNPRFVKALHQMIKLSDITLRDNCAVLEIKTKNNKFDLVETTCGKIAAENIIIASGAWSADLFNTVDNQEAPQIDINPVRGQMMIIKTPPGTLKRIILDNEHYLIPREDGRVLIGSTLEFVGFDKSTTNEAHDCLLEAANSIAPALSDYPVEFHWAGLRPGTVNGIPYICKHPDISGIYINSGHYRNGIVLGLASARLMSDLVLNRPPILNPEHYQCH